jgi:hypothetical protein
MEGNKIVSLAKDVTLLKLLLFWGRGNGGGDSGD